MLNLCEASKEAALGCNETNMLMVTRTAACNLAAEEKHEVNRAPHSQLAIRLIRVLSIARGKHSIDCSCRLSKHGRCGGSMAGGLGGLQLLYVGRRVDARLSGHLNL